MLRDPLTPKKNPNSMKLFVSNKFDPAKQKLHQNNISGTELMRRMITKGLDVKTVFVAKGMGCQCFLQRVN
jgi:tartrate dehydratase alpha subunit/fumarate hydratase class I-like protein